MEWFEPRYTEADAALTVSLIPVMPNAPPLAAFTTSPLPAILPTTSLAYWMLTVLLPPSIALICKRLAKAVRNPART